MGTQTQPIDPINAPGAPQPVETRICTSCCAKLQLSAFGLNKLSRNGHDNVCRECRAQYQRLQRKTKYGSKSTIDDSIIRSVKIHNETILDAALSTNKMELRGFDTVSLAQYKVFFGPSERLGLTSLTLFTNDGGIFMEWAISGLKDPKAALMAYMKHHSIRLEFHDANVMASKNVIYYL